MQVTYHAEVLFLVGRFCKVEVVDDYECFWIGKLFGFTVKGSGGKGKIRDCKVIEIVGGSYILAEVVEIHSGKQLWKKV